MRQSLDFCIWIRDSSEAQGNEESCLSVVPVKRAGACCQLSQA